MKNLFTVLVMLLFSTVLLAFVPPSQKLNYQAVVRNSSNALVSNQVVGMKISILFGSASGTVVYAETQTPTTNANGMINISIGSGVVVSGTYSTIEWGRGTHFLKTEIDPTGGTAYSITSTSELLSVPYALYASYTKTAANAQSLTLPFENSSGYTTTPFSITNTGSSAYTIAGISANGTGIYGETTDDNSPGVFGIGSGTGTSSGVMGKTGEPGGYEVLPGNVGVQGRSDAHIGVAGTAISGTGGYFSSRTGQALFTKGGVKLTGIGEAAGSILTSDAAGIASWKVPVWLQSGDNIYFNTNSLGKVGIGTSTPSSSLHVVGGLYVVGGSEIARFQSAATSRWIALYQDNTRKGILWSVNDDIKLLSDAGGVAFRTSGIDRMTITADGKTGIGDTSPEATLDVEGTVVIGTGGKVFSEIREITGTTAGVSSYYVAVPYPTGYTMTNTRVLSIEINAGGNAWVGIGFDNNNISVIPISYNLSASEFYIFYPNLPNCQNRAFRMLVMKVQ